MPQTYEVFTAESVVRFSSQPLSKANSEQVLRNPNETELRTIYQEMKNEGTEVAFRIIGDTEKNWLRFRSLFDVIEAAGGLVRNLKNDWLLIHRNGKWDLPKGKLEKDEEIEACAVREVAEECGIAEPTIERSLGKTFHTYRMNGKDVLKTTHWYLMRSDDEGAPSPQLEEGITSVGWCSDEQAVRLLSSSYPSVSRVFAKR